MLRLQFSLLILCGVCALLVRGGEGMAQTPTLELRFQRAAAIFETSEIELRFKGAWSAIYALPDTQVHDAYDADRDGVYVDVQAEFRGPENQTLTVPAFAMRDAPNGPWVWRVRWSPPARGTGRWSLHVFGTLGLGPGHALLSLNDKFPDLFEVSVKSGITGPLLAPGPGDDTRYLRRLNADGNSAALWLFGACRAWVVDDRKRTPPPGTVSWIPNQWLDRKTELFPALRASGYNLLNQWLAPWEFSLVHQDRAEYWQDSAGTWQRHALNDAAAWSSFQCYDQGRAHAFDDLVNECEGGADPGRETIHLLLSVLPHPLFQAPEHPWSQPIKGGVESCWSSSKREPQALARLNGFAKFREGMTVWQFFEADPAQPRDAWRSRLFDHQANFFRYVLARWGASRAIGAWVLIDELEAVGDQVGSLREKTGWWAHPECAEWLSNMLQLHRGTLLRNPDGPCFSGDPWHHPLHAATTSVVSAAGHGVAGDGAALGQIDRGGNLDWPGNPDGSKPDIFGWHWYPSWRAEANWGDVFDYVVRGVGSYTLAPLGNHPRLLSEFGAPERSAPNEPASALYPTFYHVALWSAIFAGHAGSPMDWDDGKDFGELQPRARSGSFDAEHYPVDNAAEVRALKKFLGPLTPGDMGTERRIGCSSLMAGVHVFALHSKISPDRVYGYVISLKREARFEFNGLKPAAYKLTWYDPWTGAPIPGLEPLHFSAEQDRGVRLDALPALLALRKGLKPFPEQSRKAQGHDAAFKLLPDD